MNQIKIILSLLMLFALILAVLCLAVIVASPLFPAFISARPEPASALTFIFRQFVAIHRHFFLFSLFAAFLLYYSFMDLEMVKSKNYMISILLVPLAVSAALYLAVNFHPLFLKGAPSGRIISSYIAHYPPLKAIIYDPALPHHYAFLLFIFIPACLLANYRKWPLLTALMLLAVIPAVFLLFRFYNMLILNLLSSAKSIRPFFKTGEIALALSYIPIGYYLLKLADRTKKIKERIDLGKIRKIHP